MHFLSLQTRELFAQLAHAAPAFPQAAISSPVAHSPFESQQPVHVIWLQGGLELHDEKMTATNNIKETMRMRNS
jgi:hypothetical protein